MDAARLTTVGFLLALVLGLLTGPLGIALPPEGLVRAETVVQ